MLQPSREPAGAPEMTLAAWAALGEDEPGELVDGRLDALWAEADRMEAPGDEGERS